MVLFDRVLHRKRGFIWREPHLVTRVMRVIRVMRVVRVIRVIRVMRVVRVIRVVEVVRGSVTSHRVEWRTGGHVGKQWRKELGSDVRQSCRVEALLGSNKHKHRG